MKTKSFDRQIAFSLIAKFDQKINDFFFKRLKHHRWFNEFMISIFEMKIITKFIFYSEKFRSIYDDTKNKFKQKLQNHLNEFQIEWNQKSTKNKKKSIKFIDFSNDNFLKSLYRQFLIIASILSILFYWFDQFVKSNIFLITNFVVNYLKFNDRLLKFSSLQNVVTNSQNIFKFNFLNAILQKMYEYHFKLLIFSIYISIISIITKINDSIFMLSSHKFRFISFYCNFIY